MKKLLLLQCVFLFAFLFILIVGSDPTALRAEIWEGKVIIDGKLMEYEDPAVMIGDRIYVPVRATAENAGSRVDWHEEEQTVTVVDPWELFYLRAHFRLPTFSSFVQYEAPLSEWGEQQFSAKIRISKESYRELIFCLENSTFDKTNSFLILDENGEKNMAAIREWEDYWQDLWDENADIETLHVYETMSPGIRAKTIITWLFLLEESDGNYALYISGW